MDILSKLKRRLVFLFKRWKTHNSILDNEEVSYFLNCLVPVWQKCRTTQQLWLDSISTLKQIDLLPAHVLANQLIMVYRMLSGENLKELEKLFEKLRCHIIEYCEKQHIPIDVSWRQKSFLAMMEKFLLFISTGKPLSRLNDVFGCRFVVGDKNTNDRTSVNWCYEVLNEILAFCVYNLDATLILAEAPNGPAMSKIKAIRRGYYIPAKQPIMDGCEGNVKDYVYKPKKNGYRALHAAVRFPNGLVIEFQIRSYDMHQFAEKDSAANHDAYKEERYGMPLVPEGLNLEELNVEGFNYKDGILISDLAGILISKENFGI